MSELLLDGHRPLARPPGLAARHAGAGDGEIEHRQIIIFVGEVGDLKRRRQILVRILPGQASIYQRVGADILRLAEILGTAVDLVLIAGVDARRCRRRAARAA